MRMTQRMVEGKLRMTVLDPRCTKLAAKAHAGCRSCSARTPLLLKA